MNFREALREKQRVVVKVGTSTLTHDSGSLNLRSMEHLVRALADLHGCGKDVVLVSSGAIGVGSAALGLGGKPAELGKSQACAAVGQARLMMIYQKLFMEYNQMSGQILMTKNTLLNDLNRYNARNTFQALLQMGVIPIVNENDTVSTYEIQFGDNDTLSAIVAALIGADLLILLSDIDGLFSDDPRTTPGAKFIDLVENLDEHFLRMGKATTGSKVGTGGMATKLSAAKIATSAGADMVIANGEDPHVLHKILEGRDYGTLFAANPREEFYLLDYIKNM